MKKSVDRKENMKLIIATVILLFTFFSVTYADFPSSFVVGADQVQGNTDKKTTIAYWRLNEVHNGIIKDATKNNNDGQVIGARLVRGYRGRALQFDGVDDYVRVPDSDSFNTQNITIEAWIKIDGVNGDTLVDEIIGKDNQYAFGIGDQIFNGRLAFSLGGMPASFPTCHGSGFCDGGGPLIVNQWHHVAIQYNGATVQTFIDGNQAMSYQMSFIMLTSSDDLGIGARPQPNNAAGGFFRGSIDEVKISNQPLY